MFDHVAGAHRYGWIDDDYGDHPLAPFLVRQADHRAELHAVELGDRLLDFAGIDVLATADDHVLDPIDNGQQAGGIAVAGIAGAVPAIAERGGGQRGLLAAWRGLVSIGQIKAGDQVLVEGTGGVSIFALQFAKAFGATVYATSASPAKIGRLRQLGAAEVVDYRADPNWGETINSLSDGGVDHVIDVGGSSTLSQSISAVRVDGSVVMIGILGGLTAEINIAQLLMKQQRIRPIAVGSRAMQLDMVAAIEAWGLKPVIDRVFPFERLADAFHHQLSGQHFGKIVVDLDA